MPGPDLILSKVAKALCPVSVGDEKSTKNENEYTPG